MDADLWSLRRAERHSRETHRLRKEKQHPGVEIFKRKTITEKEMKQNNKKRT